MLRFSVVIGMLVACGSNVLADLEVVCPSEKQTLLLRGSAEVSRGVRTVTGSVDATGHGPVAYYTVPFRRGNSLCLQPVARNECYLRGDEAIIFCRR